MSILSFCMVSMKQKLSSSIVMQSQFEGSVVTLASAKFKIFTKLKQIHDLLKSSTTPYQFIVEKGKHHQP